MMTKTLIRGLVLGALALAISGCYYGPPPAPAYGYYGGYPAYPSYPSYGYYGPSVSFGYYGGGWGGGWHHHDWH